MPDDLSVSPCPHCDRSEHVRPKLLATNLLLPQLDSEPSSVEKLSQFRDSPHSLGDYFVSGLFCARCDLGFVPEDVATSIGVDSSKGRWTSLQYSKPFGVGDTCSDISDDSSGNSVRPYQAIVWHSAPDSVGFRTTIHAQSYAEARRLLALEHGPETTFYMWNHNDLEKPR